MKKLTKSQIYMIGGILILVLVVAGSTYAYYSTMDTQSISENAAGAELSMTIKKISISAKR